MLAQPMYLMKLLTHCYTDYLLHCTQLITQLTYWMHSDNTPRDFICTVDLLIVPDNIFISDFIQNKLFCLPSVRRKLKVWVNNSIDSKWMMLQSSWSPKSQGTSTVNLSIQVLFSLRSGNNSSEIDSMVACQDF